MEKHKQEKPEEEQHDSLIMQGARGSAIFPNQNC